MDNEMKLPVDSQRLREFTGILQKYKAGKHSVERRTIAAENWWKLRNQAEERKTSEGLSGFQAVSGWLHNVIVSKHADAMDNRDTGVRAQAQNSAYNGRSRAQAKNNQSQTKEPSEALKAAQQQAKAARQAYINATGSSPADVDAALQTVKGATWHTAEGCKIISDTLAYWQANGK